MIIIWLSSALWFRDENNFVFSRSLNRFENCIQFRDQHEDSHKVFWKKRRGADEKRFTNLVLRFCWNYISQKPFSCSVFKFDEAQLLTVQSLFTDKSLIFFNSPYYDEFKLQWIRSLPTLCLTVCCANQIFLLFPCLYSVSL